MKTDIVLLGHGSRRGRCTNEGLRETARRLQERFTDGTRVSLGFFEFLSPTLEEAIADLAGSGTQRVVVMPYFLFDGKEIKVEIPDALQRIRQRLPQVEIVQASNLGVDERLIDLIVERIEGALRGYCQFLDTLPRLRATGQLGVVLVNRGSRARYDPGTRLNELCDLLSQRLADKTLITPAQAENSELTVEVAINNLIEQGAKRVVVVPYLHYPGKVLVDNVIPDVQRARINHRGVQVTLASTLCVDDRLVDLCSDRIRASGLLEA